MARRDYNVGNGKRHATPQSLNGAIKGSGLAANEN